MKNPFKRIKDAIFPTGKRLKEVGIDSAKAVAGNAVIVAGKVKDAGSDVLDTVMRKSTDDAVREYMLIQSRYNDIIALKLDEALKRIEALEKRLGEE